jgi:hypothetical protein
MNRTRQTKPRSLAPKYPPHFPPVKHIVYEFDISNGYFATSKHEHYHHPLNLLPLCIKGYSSKEWLEKYNTDKVIVEGDGTIMNPSFIMGIFDAQHPNWFIGSLMMQTDSKKSWGYTVLIYQHTLSGKLHVFFFTEADIKPIQQRVRWANGFILQLRRTFRPAEYN